MKDPGQVIEQLIKSIFTADRHEEIRGLLSSLGRFAFIESTLHPGNEFIRARVLRNEETIAKVQDLSFKPQQFNKTYQRASTPNKTMFYASLLQPDFQPQGFKAMARAVGLLETLPAMRDKQSKGIWKMAYGKWTNIKDLKLAAICYKKDFSLKNPRTEFLYNAFNEQLAEIGDMKDASLMITDYLAYEYAKEVPLGDHESYMISAIFSEICIEKGFDGIIYPSVRTVGEGINLATTSEFVDQHMKLIAAGECTVYKNGEQTTVLNDTVAEIAIDGKLILKPVDDPDLLKKEIEAVKKNLNL
jgi:hypothetical protein